MRPPAWLEPLRDRAARVVGPWVWQLNRETVRADATAGLVGAVVVLPQGIAFAALAGLPPAWGLDRKSTRLNSSHSDRSRMPSSA